MVRKKGPDLPRLSSSLSSVITLWVSLVSLPYWASPPSEGLTEALGSQCGAPGPPAAAVASDNLLEMHILSPSPSPASE